MVVVNHHDGLLDVGDLIDDDAGEILVDDVVAELEGLDLVAANVGRVRQVPQVVLDEPQHRVGEDVVEAVVGVGIGLDEPHEVGAAARRADLERALSVPRGRCRVVLGHRRGDPDHLAVRGKPGERGDEPAAAARDRPVGLERDRATVRDEHQSPALFAHNRRRYPDLRLPRPGGSG